MNNSLWVSIYMVLSQSRDRNGYESTICTSFITIFLINIYGRFFIQVVNYMRQQGPCWLNVINRFRQTL